MKHLCASSDSSGTSQLHIQTHRVMLCLLTPLVQTCVHKDTKWQCSLNRCFMKGQLAWRLQHQLFIWHQHYFSIPSRTLNDSNYSAMWVFLNFFAPLLSSSIIKLQDSNQNKNPSSLAVSWEASRGRAISLLLRHLSSKPDPVHPVHPYFRYILQYIVHFSTYYIPVMCVYTQVKEEELWSQW